MQTYPQFSGMRSGDYYNARRMRNTGYTKGDYVLRDRLEYAGIDASLDDARILRRAEMTLHRWHEGARTTFTTMVRIMGWGSL